jgi:hypothetical protein
MSGEPADIAQHTLSLLRKKDTRLDEILLRLSMPEHRGAPKDEEAALDRLPVAEPRRRGERIERRLELAP